MRLAILLALGLSSFFTFSACGTAAPACNPATCGGCCLPDGQCAAGTEDSACGAAALNCNVCGATQACVARRCEFVAVDAGSQPVDAGSPIVAPVETWTWADFPDSACGNGAPTGLGVNVTARSKDVLVFLQGGGACWNAATCAFAASNIDTGYTGSNFSTDATLGAAPFNRANQLNPFKDMSFVYVPYCTGDVHGGDAVQSYPSPAPQIPARTVHHKGAKNVEAFLVRLRDTFPDAQRVFLAGSSAGAFGAQLNYERVAAAWPGAEVHLLADCGQMITPAGSLLTEWLTAWNVVPPADCAGCTTDFSKFPAYLHAKYPTRRFGLLAYTQDNTLRQFSGLDAATFQQRTLALSASAYDPTVNAKYFIVAGSNHVMLGNLFTLQGPNNTPLAGWISREVTGDAAWMSVKP